MADASDEAPKKDATIPEPTVGPEVNRLLLPPDVYPRAATAPRPTVRPQVTPARLDATSTPATSAPRRPETPKVAQPSSLPPSQSFGPLLDLVTIPALGELGMKPDEARNLMGSIKGALDVFTDGKPQDVLPVPQGVEKMSKMAEHLLPVVQEVVVPRLPYVVAGIQRLLKPEDAPAPASALPEAPASPAQRQRHASAIVKETLKQKSGQTVADGGKLISFPDEARESDIATPRAPPESVYTGPRSPPTTADAARRETKIEFYGAKDRVPGADIAAPRDLRVTEKARERPTAADADALRRLPVAGASFTPANVPEGTWAEERRDALEPHPDASESPAAATAKESPMTSLTAPALSAEEAALILDSVRGHAPELIESLVLADMDISGFVVAKKNRLTSQQRERIRQTDFAGLLAVGEDLAAKDAEFAKRWSVLMRPKGRVWFKKNYARIQAVLA